MKILCVFSLMMMLLSLGACFRSSPPIHFYLLKPTVTAMAEGLSGAESPTLGLGPIRVAAYLDRPQIVTAISEQEFKVAEDERWAEPLSDSVPRVLAENLSKLIPTDKIVFHPWPAQQKPDIQVGVNIQELHADAAGYVRLTAFWKIEYADKKASRHRFSCNLMTSSTGYEQMVAAESACLGNLSKEIAKEAHTHFPD